ncbi:hypothetical protein ACLKA7_017637 [Drosophila subpalustris]
MNNTRNDESPERFAINATIVNRKARGNEAMKPTAHSTPAMSWQYPVSSVLQYSGCIALVKIYGMASSKGQRAANEQQQQQQQQTEPKKCSTANTKVEV